jgi:hypothetical protein
MVYAVLSLKSEAGHWTLNYFNYFTEIEDAFIRRRGKHLLLSPMDWALIESWKTMDIPLHVALRGIEKAFDSWEAKPRKRTVKSLLYCQEEVEAQYAEWLESRVGAETASNEATLIPAATDAGLPFSRQAILDHLRRGKSDLARTFAKRNTTSPDDLTDALERAVSLLEGLEKDLASSTRPDAQRLEISLTGIERTLSDAIRLVVPATQLEETTKEIKEQLRPYRKHMDKEVYDQTFDNLLLKSLRARFAVPRLSLFYL